MAMLTQKQKDFMIEESMEKLKQVGAITSINNNGVHTIFTLGTKKGDLYPRTGIYSFNANKGKGIVQLLGHLNAHKLHMNSF